MWFWQVSWHDPLTLYAQTRWFLKHLLLTTHICHFYAQCSKTVVVAMVRRTSGYFSLPVPGWFLLCLPLFPELGRMSLWWMPRQQFLPACSKNWRMQQHLQLPTHLCHLYLMHIKTRLTNSVPDACVWFESPFQEPDHVLVGQVPWHDLLAPWAQTRWFLKYLPLPTHICHFYAHYSKTVIVAMVRRRCTYLPVPVPRWFLLW
jgi:hypothetical protein